MESITSESLVRARVRARVRATVSARVRDGEHGERELPRVEGDG